MRQESEDLIEIYKHVTDMGVLWNEHKCNDCSISSI
ncbi:hypothetical protein C5S31_11600 [ANME-1 cluster archaeon GoMg2]|nr:hypothetical protein [ANME-1 cluster archaeon GoMg2]